MVMASPSPNALAGDCSAVPGSERKKFVGGNHPVVSIYHDYTSYCSLCHLATTNNYCYNYCMNHGKKIPSPDVHANCSYYGSTSLTSYAQRPIWPR